MFALIGGLAVSTAQARSYTACVEPGEGPPWLYLSRAAAEEPARMQGFTADIWPALFQSLGHELTLMADLPFKRCLRAVARGEVDFTFGIYLDAERAKTLAFSAPYKTLTPQVFFRSANPIRVKGRAELKQWRGCGMNGSSYEHYGLSQGELDQGARNFRTLIEKLLAGRCDYFVEELEVVEQLELGKRNYLATPGLAHAPVPGAPAPAPAFHIVARPGSDAARLLPNLDASFEKALHRGEVQRVWKRHAGDIPF